MSRIACFSSFTFAELPAAQTMARSLKRVHPDWEVWAVIPDRAPPGLPPAALAMFDAVAGPAALRLDARAPWLFGRTATEMVALARAWMLRHLLESGAAQVLHLAPRMAVFATLLPILEAAEGAGVLLSARHLVPATTRQSQQAREALARQEGLYDPGFLAVTGNNDGRGFATWLAARLEAEPEPDGRLCDLAPALFGARIARDPGCNLAPWNAVDRPIGVDAEGDFTAGAVPLRCLQFAGATAEDSPVLRELAGWHDGELRRAADRLPAPTPWAWACFQDGTPIPDAARALYRARQDLRLAFPNPFAAGAASFHAWLQAECPELMSTPS